MSAISTQYRMRTVGVILYEYVLVGKGVLPDPHRMQGRGNGKWRESSVRIDRYTAELRCAAGACGWARPPGDMAPLGAMF